MDKVDTLDDSEVEDQPGVWHSAQQGAEELSRQRFATQVSEEERKRCKKTRVSLKIKESGGQVT